MKTVARSGIYDLMNNITADDNKIVIVSRYCCGGAGIGYAKSKLLVSFQFFHFVIRCARRMQQNQNRELSFPMLNCCRM